MNPPNNTDDASAGERRHAVLPTVRWLVPVAIALGIIGVIAGRGPAMRWAYVALTVGVIGMWLFTRVRRPVLVVDDTRWRVLVRGREILRVRFADVLHVRAMPDEEAMYVDCGTPARNLLLPPRRGFGFRYQDQKALYDFLALRLADRLEIVETLVPEHASEKKAGKRVTNGHNKPDAPPGSDEPPEPAP